MSGTQVATPSAPAPASVPAPPAASPAPGLTAYLPARLGGNPPARCLVQLEAFAEAQSGNRVMLGNAAFADRDELVLTRAPRRAADGTVLDGRAGPPQSLVLNLLVGPEGCLVRVGGDARSAGAPGGPAGSAEMALPACQCQPLPR